MRLRRTVPFILIAAIALAACGAAQVVAPRLALRQAANALREDGRASFTLSLVGSEKDAIALFSEGEDDVSPEDERNMVTPLKSRLRVAVEQGEVADSFEDDSIAFDLKLGDIEDAVEARFIDGTIFARAEVHHLAELFNAPAGVIDEFVAGAREMGFDFVADGAAGRWLALELAPLQSFLKGMGEQGELFPGMGNLDLGSFNGLIDAVAGAWGSDVKVKRLDGDDAADHYRLTASARRLYERLLPALRGLPFLTPEDLIDPSEVWDKNFDLELWVKDGRIVRAEFDLAQFSESANPPGHVILRVDIDRHPDGISAPSDAVKIDLFEIIGRLGASAAAGLEEVGSTFG